MIDSVERIEIVKAIQLPPVFGILVGMESVYFEVVDTDATHIYFRELESGDLVNASHDMEMSIVVPDSWENAKWDIALGLMKENLI
jgi:hypothetical protein